MTRLPRSLLHAVRDLVAVTATALVLGTGLALWSVHVEVGWWSDLGVDVGSPAQLALPLTRTWLLRLAPFLLVVWCASRARVAIGTRWRPLTVGLVLVLGGAALAVLPGPGGYRLIDAWPGPLVPFRPGRGAEWVLGASPAWGYPVLTGTALVAAAVLGVRDGRGEDDQAVTGLSRVPRGGALLTLAVVGIPAGVATGAAVLTEVATTRPPDSPWFVQVGVVLGPLLLLLHALLGAALVSGTGPLGLVAAALAALPTALLPVKDWLAGGPDLLLVQAAASLAACAAVAVWRPCALWAAGALTDSAAPPPTFPEPAA